MKRGVLVSILVLVAIATGLAITGYIVELHEDRQATVTVTGKVLVYDTETPAAYKRGEQGVIEVLNPPDRVEVLRVLNHEDFQAIRIQLHDGRIGYIFCCENFQMSR